VNRLFGKLQLASSAYMGFSHGMSDATKCMGIITLALVSATAAGLFENVPSWLGFLKTLEGSDPYKLSLGDHIISWLPAWLRTGVVWPWSARTQMPRRRFGSSILNRRRPSEN
jgi:hypothetical protein